MSDSLSDSSDSGNNNLPFGFDNFLGLNLPQERNLRPNYFDVPRARYFLEMPPQVRQNVGQFELSDSSSSSIDTDDSSYSESIPESLENNAISSSDSDVSVADLSDDSTTFTDYIDIDEEFPTVPHTHGSISCTIPFSNGTDGKNVPKVVIPKLNYWCSPKELYKREIGFNKSPTIWSNKFYQSLVATQKLKISKQLKGHKGCVNSLDFNTTGDMIASGSDDLRIRLWDWSKEKCLLRIRTAHTRNIFQTKFLTTQGDIRVVSSARDGLIILSAVNNCDVIYSKIIARHGHSCNKIGVHPDLPYMVLSCGEDGVVKNIDIRESPINENQRITNILRVKNKHDHIMHLYGIDINPMNPFEFIVNGDDEFVRMYDKRNLSSGPFKLFHHESPRVDYDGDDDYDDSILFSSHITSAVYNYCGTEILASYSEDDIYLFDVNGPRKLHNIYSKHYGGHLNKMTVKGVNFYGPRSDYVISGSDCGHVFIWDKKSEIIVQKTFADSKGAVNVLEAHPHMPTLATSGLEKTIKIWEPLLCTVKESNRLKLRKSVVRNMIERNISRSVRDPFEF